MLVYFCIILFFRLVWFFLPFRSEWKPPGGRVISVCGCNSSQVVCAAGPALFYLEVKEGKLQQGGDVTLEHEVACIDVTPLNNGGEGEGESVEDRTDIAAVGLWTDITVRLLRLPSLEEVAREPLGGEVIPRSILMARFEGTNYLLCALGDGSLFYFVMTAQGLADKKKVS